MLEHGVRGGRRRERMVDEGDIGKVTLWRNPGTSDGVRGRRRRERMVDEGDIGK
jgi:hypothetical protein